MSEDESIKKKMEAFTQLIIQKGFTRNEFNVIRDLIKHSLIKEKSLEEFDKICEEAFIQATKIQINEKEKFLKSLKETLKQLEAS